MNEKFVPIEGYEGLYNISNLGTIISVRKNKEIGTSKSKYKTVTLHKDKKPMSCSVHRLVALTFINNPENKREVNHIDGNTLNNNVKNLEWVTPMENTIHAIKIGLRKDIGICNSRAKLSEEEVLEIKKSKLSNRKLGLIYNVSSTTVGYIKIGKLWKHVNVN